MNTTASSPGKQPTKKRGSSGGPGAAGGLNFQAAVTANAMAACAVGTSVDWWPNLSTIPSRVWAESKGPGDDIRLELDDGRVAEIQVKKGLERGADLWDALLALATGLVRQEIALGLLAVSFGTSGTIVTGLSNDIGRLATGRQDELTDIGKDFLQRLQAAHLDPAVACQGLAIQMIHALEVDGADIRNATSMLKDLVADARDASRAWGELYRDAGRMIEARGARDALGVARLLGQRGIGLTNQHCDAPALVALAHRNWVMETSSRFTIIGVKHRLNLADAWIPVTCAVSEVGPETSLEDALKQYHAGGCRSRDAKSLNPLTLGRFYRQAIVVAGPGMGKSTLLKRLAWTYVADGYPVARASLKAVAKRMSDRGESFREAFFGVALGDAPHPNAANLIAGPWVLLCDGLDECGPRQGLVGDGMVAYAIAHPDDHIVAVTRPVGFQSARFAAWRHYHLSWIDSSSAVAYLAGLVGDIRAASGAPLDDPYSFVRTHVAGGKAEALASSSPLLLSLSAALLARGATLSGEVADVYRRIFDLLESEPTDRSEVTTDSPLRSRILDILGKAVLFDPLQTIDAVETACARQVAVDTGAQIYAAREKSRAAIGHWEGLGVVERLHHDAGDIFTFVHKTIGEYAAARYAKDLEKNDRRAWIANLAARDDSEVVLDFIASLGDAEMVCEVLLDRVGGEAEYRAALRALSVGFKHETDISPALHERLLNTAFGLVRSASREVGVATGSALIKLARTAANPSLFAARARPLLTSPVEWARLTAWSVMAVCAIYEVSYEDIKATYAEIAALYMKDERRTFTRGLRLFGNTTRDLLEPFALAATRRILETETPQDAERLIRNALDSAVMQRTGFYISLSSLLAEFNRKIDFAHLEPTRSSILEHMDRVAGESEALYVQIIRPFAGDDDEAVLEPESLLVDLAALVNLCDLDSRMKADASIETESALLQSLDAAAHAVASIANLSPSRLAGQARRFLTRLDDADDHLRQFSLPDVDHPPLDWTKINAGADLFAFEPLLQDGNHNASVLAAKLIDGAGRPDIAWEIGARALQAPRGWGPAFGTALMRNACPDRDLAPVYARIQQPEDGGLRSLLCILRQPAPPMSEDAIAAVTRGLRGSEDVAEEAARLGREYAKRGDAEILPAL